MLPDGALSQAVLIGVSTFNDPELPPLPMVINNLDALWQTFTHPDWWGVPSKHCRRLDDQDGPLSADSVREALDDAASRAEDLFLVYYAGHGIPQDPGDLVLAVTQTVWEVPRARGISIGEIRDAFLNSRARTRMLILDCCFSGRALENMGLDKPTATLASVPSTSESEAPEGEEFTEFGGHLVWVLRHGIRSGPALLTLQDIAAEIHVATSERGSPRLQASLGADRVALVRNVAKAGSSVVLTDRRSVDHLADVVRGIDAVARPIRRTLGPRSLAALITLEGGVRREESDAATIARSFRAERQRDEIGVSQIRRLVQTVHRRAGDGAAIAVVLAHALIDGVFESLRRNTHPGELMKGVQRGIRWAGGELTRQAVVVESNEQLLAVTTTATRDPALAAIVARAVNRAGTGGAILVEEAHAFHHALELAPGMRIVGGCVAPELFTDHEREEAVLEYPHVLVVDELQMRDLKPALDTAIDRKQPLAILAASVREDALRVLVTEQRRGVDSVVVTANPAVLDEIRARTPIKGEGRWRAGQPPRLPGSLRKIVATRDQTIILWEPDGRDETPLVPVVRVGADTAASPHERRRLAETAVSVALGAIEEGVVPGGGIALLTAHFTLQDMLDRPEAHRPERLRVPGGQFVGLQVVTQALAAPALQMWQNARLDAMGTLIELHAGSAGDGFDLLEGGVGSMFGRGITDALVVVRTALEEALSVTQRFARLA
ncbi:MAG: caspase, EACC1-associated type [Pseudonocardiaceae bacterium]